MSSIKKIVILVLILAVPGFLYYLLTSQGKNRYKPLPFYGPKPLSGTFHTFHGKKIPDTLFHKAGDFNLLDQDGKPVSFKTLEGQILVISFFYTHCPDICTKVNANMDSLAGYYIKNKLVTFASITVDPQRDNAAVLKSFAAQYRQPASKWKFLTGDTTTIYTLARKGLFVDALQSGKDEFIASSKIVLLDPERRIRGYYDGTSATDVTRLVDELKVQISEELRKKEKPLY
ncbi:SCO family protein [Mucilaginibacter mali]|uniref:SCO family protein n=1 Tax=Mucilaginibacter mali TaxID=2740462 RepID=A0A7D4PVN0_9SPHI|nr:SCO family protein [Mucilaginibacter mali]QKJ31163.1 SCO family protein [Mucilaginibacter mali]